MIERFLQKKLIGMAKSFPAISVTGPRQSGKTTLVKKAFPKYEYINLENLDERNYAEEDPRSFLNQYIDRGVIIDEAQKAPILFNYLQEILDASSQPGRFILTGSQNFLLMEKVTQSLAGRVGLLNLLPFGFHELPAHHQNELSIETLLFNGLYPALYDRCVKAPDFYPSYLQTYIERDVRTITNVSDLALFRRFVQLCAGRTGQILNLSNLANDASIDHKTAKAWLSILESSFVIFLLNPYYKNFSKRISKSPKLYFFDTGVVSSLLGIQSSDQLMSHPLKGNLFETLIISEYVKFRYHSAAPQNAFFWSEYAGNEVDLLLEHNDGLVPVEIKSGQTLSKSFFKGLKYFPKIASGECKRGYLIYGGTRSQAREACDVIAWQQLSDVSTFVKIGN